MGTRRIFRRGGGAQNVKYPPCLASPWDSVGGVGQGQFCILHKSGIDSPILWRSPVMSSGRVCWDCWQYGRSAWALAVSGAQAGRRSYTVIFWPFLFPSPFSPLFPFLLSLVRCPGWCWLCCLAGGCMGWGWLSSGLLLAVPSWAGSGCKCWPLVFPLPCLASSPFWVSALGFGAAVSLCPSSWVLAFLCCPLVLACYALGLGAGLGWGRCWGCPGRGGGGWLGLVGGDLAGLGFVMLHKYSLADLVIIQGKSDKF